MQTIAKRFRQPMQARRALGILVLLAVLSGLRGWWAAGTLFCAIAVLLIVILLLDALKG
jgi:fatty acid desaturase